MPGVGFTGYTLQDKRSARCREMQQRAREVANEADCHRLTANERTSIPSFSSLSEQIKRARH